MAKPFGKQSKETYIAVEPQSGRHAMYLHGYHIVQISGYRKKKLIAILSKNSKNRRGPSSRKKILGPSVSWVDHGGLNPTLTISVQNQRLIVGHFQE